MINLSVLQGDFPSEMKLAKVLPIYKVDNHQLIQNYRPITVLKFFSKVYERVIYNNLLDFIMDINILYDKLFGFRKGHSTSHAIITLVDKVSKSLDKGKIVGGVYLDIRKAFDSISHKILLVGSTLTFVKLLTVYRTKSFLISYIILAYEEIFIVY